MSLFLWIYIVKIVIESSARSAECAWKFATTRITKWSTVAVWHPPNPPLGRYRILAYLPLFAQSSTPPTPWGDREEIHLSASRHTKRPSTIANTVINTVAHSLTRSRVATYHRRWSALILPLRFLFLLFPTSAKILPARLEKRAHAKTGKRGKRKNGSREAL